jgi:hypothetical protein
MRATLNVTHAYITSSNPNPIPVFTTPHHFPHLRHPTKPLGPASTKALVKVIRRIRAKSIPPIRAHALRLVLRLGDSLVELGGRRVDELEL